MKKKYVYLGIVLPTTALLCALLLDARAAELSKDRRNTTPIKELNADASPEDKSRWGISCVTNNGQQICTMGQEISLRENNQRVVTMEIKPDGMKRAAAGLTLPFGLNLKAGVELQIDNGPVVQGISFSTCLQQGCMVPMIFDQSTLAAMRKGKILRIGARLSNQDKKVNFELPLEGFTDAYIRMNDLIQHAVQTVIPTAKKAG